MVERPKTFDPFDAPLWRGHQYYRELPDPVRAKNYQYTVWVDPRHWDQHMPDPWVFSLEWRSYRYSDVDSPQRLREIVTQDDPGIYIFAVHPEQTLCGFPCYALYVGISNSRGSNRPIHERLSDYLPKRIAGIRKRKNIHKMILLYFSCLWVHFSYVNKASNILLGIEKKLHGYLAPPFAEQAYPPDMKHQKPAFP